MANPNASTVNITFFNVRRENADAIVPEALKIEGAVDVSMSWQEPILKDVTRKVKTS